MTVIIKPKIYLPKVVDMIHMWPLLSLIYILYLCNKLLFISIAYALHIDTTILFFFIYLN